MHRSRRHFVATAVLACVFVFSAITPAAAQAPHSRPAPKKKSSKPVEKPFGREGDARRAKRTIKVETSDTMRYFPDAIRVKRGDTVRFNVHNSGQVPHTMVLGTMDGLKKHAEMMRREHHAQGQQHDMRHHEPFIAHVAPGQTGRIVWQFTKPGEFYYACLMPGHFEAGMIGTIVVR